jgi:hypothetical protein
VATSNQEVIASNGVAVVTHSSKIQNFVALVVCLSLLLGVGLSQTAAGPLAVTSFALNNGAGPDAGRWRGTASLVGAALGDTLVAEVDWAVFPVGGFQSYLNSQAIAQVDPSAPNEFTYVYQITSVTSANPGVDVLTVGIDAIDTRRSLTAPTFVPTGAATEKSPTSGGDNNTSMAWFFGGTELDPGDSSSLLVFTSPNIPEFDFLSVASGLASQAVPPLVGSPSAILGDPNVPEPSTLFLVVACVLPFLTGWRSR